MTVPSTKQFLFRSCLGSAWFEVFGDDDGRASAKEVREAAALTGASRMQLPVEAPAFDEYLAAVMIHDPIEL